MPDIHDPVKDTPMTRILAAALCCLLLAACGSRDAEGEFLTDVLKHHEAR